jgi:hypothetical protein
LTTDAAVVVDTVVVVLVVLPRWHAARARANSVASAARVRPSTGTIPANGGGPTQGSESTLGRAGPTKSLRGASTLAVDAPSGEAPVERELGCWTARETPTAIGDPPIVSASATAAVVVTRRGRTPAMALRCMVATV